MSNKTVKVQLPERMFEEFFRLFPGHGERSRFLRRVVSLTIQNRNLKDILEKRVAKEIERSYE